MRARPGLWEPWVGNDPWPPGPTHFASVSQLPSKRPCQGVKSLPTSARRCNCPLPFLNVRFWRRTTTLPLDNDMRFEISVGATQDRLPRAVSFVGRAHRR